MTSETCELKVRGAAREMLELAARHGWIVGARFPQKVRRRGRPLRHTLVGLEHPARLAVFIEYTIAGTLVSPQTVTREGASWYVRGDEDELRQILTALAPPQRPPDIAHDGQLRAGLRHLTHRGDKRAQELLERLDRALGDR